MFSSTPAARTPPRADAMLEKLQLRIQGKKVLILGVGNRLRGDDVVGSILAERLGKKLNIPIIDAADVPENYLGPIEASGADLVIVLDAADLGASPGDLSLVEREQLKEIGISTHTGNLALLFKVIPQARRPEAVLVAIQPEQTGADRGLSRSVEMAMEGLERLLIQLLRKKMDGSPTAVQS